MCYAALLRSIDAPCNRTSSGRAAVAATSCMAVTMVMVVVAGQRVEAWDDAYKEARRHMQKAAVTLTMSCMAAVLNNQSTLLSSAIEVQRTRPARYDTCCLAR